MDFKERFKKEYHELDDKINKLANMLVKYQDGTLDFAPKCSYDLLNGQLKAMTVYRDYLEERAIIEDIEL